MRWKRVHSGLLSPLLFNNNNNNNKVGFPPFGDFMSTLRLITYNSEQGGLFFLRSCTTLPQPTYCLLKDGLIQNQEVILKNPETKRAVVDVLPSIVNLTLCGRMQGWPGAKFQTTTYNGIIVDSDGTVIASAKIDRQIPLSELKVNVQLHPSFVSGECSFDGEISLVDTHHNIVIVKCKSDNPLPAAKLRNHVNLDVGEMVVTLGTDSMQHGEFPFKIVFELGFVTSSKGLHSSSNMFKDYCFSCFPGFSDHGGVLVNRDGLLVGVGSCSRALSVELIYQMTKFAKKYKRSVTPWLGMKLRFLESGGCLVCEVTPDSPADRAGICVSDVIMDFDGKLFPDKLAV